MYTSLELSKNLKDAGCDLESNFGFLRKSYYEKSKLHPEKSKLKFLDRYEKDLQNIKNFRKEVCLFSYDILYDICVRFNKEFFGVSFTTLNNVYCEKILFMLQQNKPQEEIEAYIIENSVFFKNKEAK
jgi:hypothetical protein